MTAKKRKKKKYKLKLTPIIVLLLITIMTVGFIYTHTNKYIFYKTLNKSINIYNEDYKDFIKEYLGFSNNNLKLINTNTTMKIDENITNYTGKMYLNNDNNYINLNVYRNSEKYKLNIITESNKLYYKVDDTYYYEDYNVQTYNDYEKILEIFIKKIRSYTTNKDYKKGSRTVEYFDKEYKVKTIKLSLTHEKFAKAYVAFLEEILENDDYYNSYIDLVGGDKSTIKESINEYKKVDDKTNYINYYIYLYKNRPITNELESGAFDISLFDYNDKLSLRYKEKDSTLESYLNIYNKKIELFVDGLFYGDGTYTNKKINITFKDYSKDKIGEFKYSLSKKEDKYNLNIELRANLENLNLEFKSQNTIENNKKIPSYDIKESKKVSELSDNDKKILETIFNG